MLGLSTDSPSHANEHFKREKAPKGSFYDVWWGERRGSNPRQPESQSGTLPTELRPPL